MTTTQTQQTQTQPQAQTYRADRLSSGTLVRMVAQREIVTQFLRKEMWVSLVIMIVVFCGSLGLQTAFGGDEKSTLGVVGQQREFTDALTAQSAAGGPGIEIVRYADADTARRAVRDGKAEAAVVGDGRIVVQEKLPEELGAAVQQAHRTTVTVDRLRDGGLGDAQITGALTVQPLQVAALDPDVERDFQRTMTAGIGVMLLFFMMLMFGQGIAQGVLEEKSSRIVEILLAKVTSWQLLTGKVLGIGVVALAQITAIMVCGIGFALVAGLLDAPADAISTGMLVIAWFVPGYFLFATLWALAGAMVSRQEDIQHAAGPVSFLQTIGFTAALLPFMDFSATLTRIFSIVPGSSWAVMPVRMAAEPVPWWDIVAAALLMVVTIGVLLRVGGRIYMAAILQHGGIIKTREALRRAREGAGS
ncbi:ABC transporter permease [Streptomyces sp. SYSU K21746]